MSTFDVDLGHGLRAPARSETERKLLEAGLAVFAAKGLHGASTSEIAERADVRKSTLHYYFRRKEDLYAAVFDEAFRQLAAPLEERLSPEMGFAEVLRAWVEHHVGAFGARPDVVRLWMHENLIGAPVAVPLLRRLQGEPSSPYRMFVSSLERAIEAGEVRAVDSRQTFVTVMGACLFFHVARPTMVATLPSLTGRDDGFDGETFTAARADHVLDVLWRGLRAPA